MIEEAAQRKMSHKIANASSLTFCVIENTSNLPFAALVKFIERAFSRSGITFASEVSSAQTYVAFIQENDVDVLRALVENQNLILPNRELVVVFYDAAKPTYQFYTHFENGIRQLLFQWPVVK